MRKTHTLFPHPRNQKVSAAFPPITNADNSPLHLPRKVKVSQSYVRKATPKHMFQACMRGFLSIQVCTVTNRGASGIVALHLGRGGRVNLIQRKWVVILKNLIPEIVTQKSFSSPRSYLFLPRALFPAFFWCLLLTLSGAGVSQECEWKPKFCFLSLPFSSFGNRIVHLPWTDFTGWFHSSSL